MRISRLYVNDALTSGKKIELTNESAHYLRSVLRLKKGQDIMLFNGPGGEYLCRLQEVSRKRVWGNILNYVERNVESRLTIRLGLGISRGDRMDWSIQKSVELGVNRITPILTARCIVKYNEDKKQQRLNHWRSIAQHATEQSGRTLLPTITEIDRLPDWITVQRGSKVFLDPYAKCSLADLHPDNDQITLLSGPEGGFTEQERDTAKLNGFIPVRLGQRILRTETAALAALSAVQMLWGDFN